MQITEQSPFAEVIPRASRNILRATTPARKRRQESDPTQPATAMSFSHLLSERHERPAPKPAAKRTGISEPPVTETHAPAGKPVVGGKAEETPLAAKIATATTEGSEPSFTAEQGFSGAVVPPTAEVEAALAAAEATSTPTELSPAAIAGAIGSVATATAADPETAAVLAQTPTIMPGQVAPDVSDSEKKPVLPQTAAEPRTARAPHPTAALPKTVALPQELLARDQAAVGTTAPQGPAETATQMPQDQQQAQASPASAVAQTLQTTAHGQEAYAKSPVVSEAQMVADSLKLEGLAKAKVSTKALAAAGDRAPTDSSSGQGQTAAADLGVTEASAVGDNTGLTPVEVTLKGTVSAHSGPDNKPDKSEVEAAPETTTVAMEGASEQTRSASALKAVPDGTVAGNRQVHQQVVSHLPNNLNSVAGHEKITIKLNPESLGQIEVSFEGQDDRLSVVIAATTPEADSALRENIKDLTDRIVERSSRFSQVDVRVEMRETNAARQDGKPDQKQDGRQGQRRDPNNQENGHRQQEQADRHSRQAHRARQSWESAMSWHLADQAASEEG